MRLTYGQHSPASIVRDRKWTPVWAVLCLAGAIALVLLLDRSTNLPGVQHLYYIPIIFAGGEPVKVQATRDKFPQARFCSTTSLLTTIGKVTKS